MGASGQLLNYFAHRLCGFNAKPCYHSHADYEVYYFHGGEGSVLMGDAVIELAPGDLIIFDGMKQHGSVMNRPCSRTSLLLEEAGAQPFLQLQGSLDLFRPFREPGCCHWRLSGSRKEEVEQILASIARFYNQPGSVNFARLCVAVAELLLFIYDCGQQQPVYREEAAREKEKHVRDVTAFIDRHYMDDLSMESLARSVHFSKYYISRLFKELTGMTVFEYIRRRRVSQAKLLFLLDRSQSRTVSDIGYEVGFKQANHFSRTFKQLVGEPPELYRRRTATTDTICTESGNGRQPENTTFVVSSSQASKDEETRQ